jgi:hypothetical protein
MTNSATTKTTEGTTISVLVKEGKALASIWKQTNSLKATLKANGFDTRLGKLLQELKAQSTLDSGQISRQTLTMYGINVIDRRRRFEALWFVENEVECRDFIANSKKGFNSLTALQAAMRKAAKADDETTEGKATEGKPTEGKPSNVGQSDDQPKLVEQSKQSMTVGPITRKVMVNTILAQAAINKLDLEEIIEDLMSELTKRQQQG